MNRARKRLSNRHGNVTIRIESEGFSYLACGAYFEDGGLAEIFIEAPGKAGTPLESNAKNAAIMVSLLLQYGVAPEVILHSISGPIALAIEKLSECGA
jgi:hypothetical protein